MNLNFILVTAENAEISFDKVCFEYVHGQKILDNLSFTVPAGQNYAIVGGKPDQGAFFFFLFYYFLFFLWFLCFYIILNILKFFLCFQIFFLLFPYSQKRRKKKKDKGIN